MPEDRVDRRLAAIMAGDIAGYSRLMGLDDEGTLRQLKSHRKELVDPKITEHRGRIVKTTGDGMLVEFISVVDAAPCVKLPSYTRQRFKRVRKRLCPTPCESCAPSYISQIMRVRRAQVMYWGDRVTAMVRMGT